MQRVQQLLGKIEAACRRVLGDNLTGVYVHGSLAFGCFIWERSDVDFLTVVVRPLELHEKTALLKALLDFESDFPPKGIEMSVVLEENCRAFSHPMHYELHYSNAHRESYHADAEAYCARMHGCDRDLAAHCTVIREVGYPLCGKPVRDVFGPVPRADYIDSLRFDSDAAESDIHENATYTVLNLCRVLVYLRDNSVLSKQQGGQWGLSHLPAQWHRVIASALEDYAGRESPACNAEELAGFAAFMLHEIDSAEKHQA